MTAHFDIASQIAPHLPYLRRFARALTGGQATGDEAAAATLQRIIDDPAAFKVNERSKIALYRAFYVTWMDTGSVVATPAQETSAMAAKAQDRLRSLPQSDRIAVLLYGLEGFGPDAVAEILGVAPDEAEALIIAGGTALTEQVGGRVLIIEDEPLIAMDIDGVVRALGHMVTDIVDTHHKAVDAAARQGPNLVLADIRLADGSSGIDAVEEIIQSIRVPVIFITAFPELLLTGERPEPTFLISKPFQRRELETAVGQALFFGAAAAPEPM